MAALPFLALVLFAVLPQSLDAQQVTFLPRPLDASASAERFLKAPVPDAIRLDFQRDLSEIPDSLFAGEYSKLLGPEIDWGKLLANSTRIASLDASALPPGVGRESLAQWANPTVLNNVVSEAGEASGTKTETGGPSLGALSVSSAVAEVVIASVQRQYRASAQATAMNLFETSLCGQGPRVYAPSTCAVLGGGDQFTTLTPWATAKAAFEQDLSELPSTLARNLPDSASLVVRVLVPTSVRFGLLARSGADAAELLVGLKDVGCTLVASATGDDRHAGLALFALAQAVETLVTERAYSGAELQALLNAGLALFDSRMKEAPCLEGLWGASQSAHLQELGSTFESIYHLQRSLRRHIDTARQSETPAEAFEVYLSGMLDLLDQGSRILPLSGTMRGDSLAAAQARIDASILLIRRTLTAYQSLQSRQYARGFVQLLALGEESGLPVPAGVRRWGPFMADVAQADSKEDLTAAVDAILAPVGTFREKRREESWVVSLGAYPGGRIGVERPLGGGASQEWFSGPSALVGLEISRGFGAHSLGLLFSAVDVGAHLNFSVGSEDDGDLENRGEVSLDQIFVPGAFLTWGISKKWPVTLGFGMSLLRDRREATGPDGTLLPKSVWQTSLLLAMDVPLVTF